MTPRLRKGRRCEWTEERVKGRIEQATAKYVRGVLDDGRPFVWPRPAFFKDFRLL